MPDLWNRRLTAQSFQLAVPLTGPLRMESALARRSACSLTPLLQTEVSSPRLQLTAAADGTMLLRFTITAGCRREAERTGEELAQQICDLLSVQTNVAIGLSHEVRRAGGTTVFRELSAQEWDWVAGALIRVKLKHPTFLAAAGWFRRSLLASDAMESFCCAFQVIEKISLGYGRQAVSLPVDGCNHDDEHDRSPGVLLACLTSELCRQTISNVRALRRSLLNAGAPDERPACVPEGLQEGVQQLLPDVKAAAWSVMTAVRSCYLDQQSPLCAAQDDFLSPGPDESW